MPAMVFNEIATTYDRLNQILSFGLQKRWKNTLLSATDLRVTHAVLDLAAGTGELGHLAHKHFGVKQLISIEPSNEMLASGRRKGRFIGISHEATAESLPLSNHSVDRIVCSFGVRNFDNRNQGFKECFRVLKPGGKFGILEIFPLKKNFSLLPLRFYWTRIMPALGLLLGHAKAYRYLRDSSLDFVSCQDLISELESLGFILVQSRKVFGSGLVSLIVVEKKNER